MDSVQQIYRSGLAHLDSNRLAEAEAALRTVVARDPAFGMAHFNLGLVLSRRRQWRQAAESFRAATATLPNLAAAHAGLGGALHCLGDTDEAEPRVRKALALDPRLTFAQLQLAEILRAKGKLEKAGEIYEHVLARQPDDPDARFGRGFLKLLRGDVQSGWLDYEYRHSRRGPIDPALMPQWRGEDVAGRTMLLYAEQGIGDTVQFLRYATVLARRGARILVALPVSLMELAARVEGVAGVVAPGFTLPPFDFCAPFPSLPLYCGTTLRDIPWFGPYLSPPAALPPAVPAKDAQTFTVALAWAGNPDHPNDPFRSIRVQDLAPLFEIPRIRWLILQQGRGASEIAQRQPCEIVQLGPNLNNFSDIAAAMGVSDLVISVDTSFCHLAGALGRPAWTLLCYAPDWRWLLKRNDTPWYPTMRLFRQPKPGTWPAVIAGVASALSRECAGPGRRETV